MPPEAGGWEEVPYKEDVGFCGTPDPLPPEGKDWSEDLLYLWGTLEDGDYRLSYEVGDTFDTEITGNMAVGETLSLEGRVQSRAYTKVVEGCAQERVAFEVSIMHLVEEECF